MSTEPSRSRLPFEPRQKRQKSAKTKASPPAAETSSNQNQRSPSSNESMAIPEVVSKRMARRMALLCGIPTFLGIATFFISYFLVTQVGLKLPNAAVLLVSMGFFGLGVLGLSYGVLSASWDLVRDDAIGAQVRMFGRFRTLEDLRNTPVARLADSRVVR
ncbi:MAG: DUF3464 family protein, partial [Merismopedia sp. SIO2A8]|nr:DUF3464 family protein [Merismopedia sp. SIO2A8]